MSVSLQIVGISGSPRHGNTELLVEEALRAASDAPIDVSTRMVSLAGKRIEPCSDCQVCADQKRRCVKQDDWFSLISAIIDPVPDGIIIGSPVYFFSVTAQLRAFFERCTSLNKAYWVSEFPFPPPDFSRTAAAAIAVGFHRHGGVEHAVADILHWYLTIGCVCTGADYIGGPAWQIEKNARDAVLEDVIGMRNARIVGRRIAYLAYLLSAGAKASPQTLRAMSDYRSLEIGQEGNSDAHSQPPG